MYNVRKQCSGPNISGSRVEQKHLGNLVLKKGLQTGVEIDSTVMVCMCTSVKYQQMLFLN